jgi:putative pyruvate formate lyase activating enzyme
MTPYIPVYIQTKQHGELTRRIQAVREMLRDCTLCPRRCHVNRLENQTGVCNTGEHAIVASYTLHFGEEAPVVGQGGSGTIFFTHCNLTCNFCQNYDISHEGVGRNVSDEQLSAMMLALQQQGCENINVVTPSHVVPQILSALSLAVDGGLRVPLVYNTGCYDSLETLRLLDGIFDIYMPDFKFWSADVARSTCNAPDYPEVACSAIREMHRQVGDLKIDAHGVAQCGLLVRHLVMPNGLAGTGEVMRFLAGEISPHTYVNIMAQYHPCGQAVSIPELNRRITAEEYEIALQEARDAGITRLDQPMSRLFRLF